MLDEQQSRYGVGLPGAADLEWTLIPALRAGAGLPAGLLGATSSSKSSTPNIDHMAMQSSSSAAIAVWDSGLPIETDLRGYDRETSSTLCELRLCSWLWLSCAWH